MRLFQAPKLASRKNLVDGVLERIGLLLGAGVEGITAGETVLVGRFVVRAAGDIVFVRQQRERYVDGGDIRVRGGLTPGRARPKRKIGNDGRIDRYRSQ